MSNVEVDVEGIINQMEGQFPEEPPSWEVVDDGVTPTHPTEEIFTSNERLITVEEVVTRNTVSVFPSSTAEVAIPIKSGSVGFDPPGV